MLLQYVSVAKKTFLSMCTFDFVLIYLLELCSKFKVTVVSLLAFFSCFTYYANLVLCHEYQKPTSSHFVENWAHYFLRQHCIWVLRMSHTACFFGYIKALYQLKSLCSVKSEWSVANEDVGKMQMKCLWPISRHIPSICLKVT
jgi:hypothetical protein